MSAARDKIHRSGEVDTPPIYENKWLNSLTKTHIAIPVTIFFAYAIGLIYYTKLTTEIGNGLILLLFMAGWFFFTFVEYMVHRRVYHMPAASEKAQAIAYKIHGAHHDYPKDKKRLALPPILSVLIGTLLLFLFELVLDQYSFAFLAGFVAGYASYLLVHYAVHIYRPPNNFLKALWTNHAIHHYGDEDILYGVSSPIWDHVFGTLPRKNVKRQVSVHKD